MKHWQISLAAIALCQVGLVVLFGCATSRATIQIPQIIDANEPQAAIEFTGKAADTVAKEISATLAANIQTKEGRANVLAGELKRYYGWLVIFFVGGCALWFLLSVLKMPSKFGWIIPASSVAGMVLINAFTNYADWFVYGVGVIVIALLVWKVVEYKKERNENGEKK